MIVYGLNYAVSDSDEDRTLTLQSLTKYQTFDAENFTSMCLIVRDGLGTIQNNMHKLVQERHQKMQKKAASVEDFGPGLEQHIQGI